MVRDFDVILIDGDLEEEDEIIEVRHMITIQSKDESKRGNIMIKKGENQNYEKYIFNFNRSIRCIIKYFSFSISCGSKQFLLILLSVFVYIFNWRILCL